MLQNLVNKIITFILLTFALSIMATIALFRYKALGISPAVIMLALMWCPAISALVTEFIFTRDLRSFGWGWGETRWQVMAYFIPLAYAIIGYGFIWISGLGKINHAYHFNPVALVVWGTLLNIAYAAGEEIGWRGFLVPNIYKITTYTKTCFIVGIIWALWHFPVLIGGLYLTGMPLPALIPLFLISVIGITFPISWLRLKWGGVWTAILLHASHNLYIQRLFDPLTKPTGGLSKFMTGESGIVITVLIVVLAVTFWNMRDQLPGHIYYGKPA
jgi:uncharacterized protein